MLSNKVQTAKINNFVTNQNKNNLEKYKAYRPILYLMSIFGINRSFILIKNKNLRLFSSVYNFILFTLIAYFTFSESISYSLSYLVYKYTTIIEYACLGIATYHSRKVSHKLYKNIYSIDEHLKITYEYSVNKKIAYRSAIAASILLIYNLIELLLAKIYNEQLLVTSNLVLYVPSLAQDLEQVFFCTLLLMVIQRLKVLTVHTDLVLNGNYSEEWRNTNNPENLPINTVLNVTELHIMYEKLHKCCSNINVILSFPVCNY